MCQFEGLALYPGRDSEPLRVLGRAHTIRPVFYLFICFYLFILRSSFFLFLSMQHVGT